MPNLDLSMYRTFGEAYLKNGDNVIWLLIIITAIATAIITIIIGIYTGQAIVLRMNKGEFEKLKNENERMHYEIAEFKAKEAYELKQAVAQGQGNDRPRGGES